MRHKPAGVTGLGVAFGLTSRWNAGVCVCHQLLNLPAAGTAVRVTRQQVTTQCTDGIPPKSDY